MADREVQPFLLGVYGIEVTPEMVHLLRESGAAGIYLLRRNIESPEQIRELVTSLETELGYRLLVAIDHEGGWMTRFTRGVTFFPDAMALGKTGAPAMAHEVGRAMARELSPMGINVNLAPVLDLATDEYNPEMMTRSFGETAATASDMGAEMIRGLQAGGVSATARHFPGRGSAIPRSRRIPEVATSRDDLMARDIVPFRIATAAGTELVMSACAFYPALDPTQPAMFSSKILAGLLRREIGFNGVVVTEDLSSPLVRAAMPVEEAVVRALEAGSDLLLIANDAEFQKQALKGYTQAVEKVRVSRDLIEKARGRLQALLKKKENRPPPPPDEGEEAGSAAALASMIAGAATRIERDPQKILPVKPSERVGILFPRLADIADRVVVDDDLRGAAGLVQGWMQSHATNADVLEIPIQPEGDMVDLTMDWAAALGTVVLFCFDAHRFPGQRKVLEELERRCPRVVVVATANPWDRAFLNGSTTLIQTYGFRVCQIVSAVELIFGKS